MFILRTLKIWMHVGLEVIKGITKNIAMKINFGIHLLMRFSVKIESQLIQVWTIKVFPTLRDPFKGWKNECYE